MTINKNEIKSIHPSFFEENDSWMHRIENYLTSIKGSRSRYLTSLEEKVVLVLLLVVLRAELTYSNCSLPHL